MLPRNARNEIVARMLRRLPHFDDGGGVSSPGYNWAGVGEDAAAGAGAGAVIGSVVPVIGTGVGALAGGAIGAGYGALQNYQASSVPQSTFHATDYAQPFAQAAGNNYLAANQNATGMRTQQQQLNDMLLAQAQGKGPSVARQLLAQQTAQNNAAAAGTMAAQRGISPALAQRLILQQQAASNQQAAGQGATLRAQEMLAARQALGQELGTERAGDIQQSQIGVMGGGRAGFGGTSADLQGLNQRTAQENASLKAGAQAQANAANNQFVGQMFSTASGVSGMGASGAGGGGAVSGQTFTNGQPGDYGGTYADGGPVAANYMQGGKVPGRAAVAGNSPRNDTVLARVSPGEFVIPRSVMAQSPRVAAMLAAQMVAHAKAQQGTDASSALGAKLMAARRRVAALRAAR